LVVVRARNWLRIIAVLNIALIFRPMVILVPGAARLRLIAQQNSSRFRLQATQNRQNNFANAKLRGPYEETYHRYVKL
jgi:hypothetical protein